MAGALRPTAAAQGAVQTFPQGWSMGQGGGMPALMPPQSQGGLSQADQLRKQMEMANALRQQTGTAAPQQPGGGGSAAAPQQPQKPTFNLDPLVQQRLDDPRWKEQYGTDPFQVVNVGGKYMDPNSGNELEAGKIYNVGGTMRSYDPRNVTEMPYDAWHQANYGRAPDPSVNQSDVMRGLSTQVRQAQVAGNRQTGLMEGALMAALGAGMGGLGASKLLASGIKGLEYT